MIKYPLKMIKNPWSLIIEIPYRQKNSRAIRDKIEKELSKLGEWIGHGTGFGAHDVHIAFKTEKDAKKAKVIAINIMLKNNVSGRYVITKYEGGV
jgi:hypothetical protein